jgi:hypothetical protein
MHDLVVKMPHLFLQPRFVYGAYLLKQNNGISLQSDLVRKNVNMCGQLGFTQLACDGGGNNRGAVSVSHVVLNDQNRSDPALLRAYDRAQVGIIYVPSADGFIAVL